MSGIRDTDGNPLQVNAIYNNRIYIPNAFIMSSKIKINLKYLEYRPDIRSLVFQLDDGKIVFKKIDGNVNNNYELIIRPPSVEEPPPSQPSQPPMSEEKGSEEKGGKRRRKSIKTKSRKSRKSRRSRKSKKSRRSRK